MVAPPQDRVGLAEYVGVAVSSQWFAGAVAACEDLPPIREADQSQMNPLCQREAGGELRGCSGSHGEAGYGWVFILQPAASWIAIILV